MKTDSAAMKMPKDEVHPKGLKRWIFGIVVTWGILNMIGFLFSSFFVPFFEVGIDQVVPEGAPLPPLTKWVLSLEPFYLPATVSALVVFVGSLGLSRSHFQMGISLAIAVSVAAGIAAFLMLVGMLLPVMRVICGM